MAWILGVLKGLIEVVCNIKINMFNKTITNNINYNFFGSMSVDEMAGAAKELINNEHNVIRYPKEATSEQRPSVEIPSDSDQTNTPQA